MLVRLSPKLGGSLPVNRQGCDAIRRQVVPEPLSTKEKTPLFFLLGLHLNYIRAQASGYFVSQYAR